MKAYESMTRRELEQEQSALRTEFAAFKERKLHLDMSRGKPGKEQLAMVSDILTCLRADDCIDDGVDARNYGCLAGLPSARRLFAQILGVSPEEVFVGGNASLNLMYDLIARAYTHGLTHSERPWSREKTIKFLCPVPGYDRHFKISETFGMEMIPVPMDENGPDMTLVEELVRDPAVRGMWCVPKYSNPSGILYSQDTILRIARLRPTAKDFTVMWDNAYCIHEFSGDFVPFPEILTLARENGNPDMFYEFASTSKITLPGAGVACFATSEENLRYLTPLLSAQIISYDKVNQLRHVRFLRDRENTLALMKRHAAVLRPKFETVIETLRHELAPRKIARFSEPKGGYFISVDAMPGTAKRALALCRELGVVITPAGATYPNGVDPQDSNIRLAPSVPSVEELRQAIDVFCVCLRLAATEKLLRQPACV